MAGMVVRLTATVADAEEHEHMVRHPRLAVVLLHLLQGARRGGAVVGLLRERVHEASRAVDLQS